eukprot:c25062_g7_i2 orf=1021-2589(+)
MGSDGGSQKSNALPPFLAKTYDMVDDPATDSIVSWSSTGTSFVVWNSTEFSQNLLPQYFKHNNFSSFVRQLNTYGFRKICPDQWEFATEGFSKGQREALKSIRRRKPLASSTSSSQAHDDAEHQQLQPESPKCTILAHQEFEVEVKRLQLEKKLLVDELTKLRCEQETTETNLVDLGKRLQSLEERQQQILSFLARVVNPAFWARFAQNPSESNMLLTLNKKRKLLVNEVGTGEYQEAVAGTGEFGDDNENIVGRVTAEKDALGTWWNNSKTLSSADVPCEGFLRQHSLCPPQNQSLGSSPISLSSGVFLREVQTPAECPENEEVLVGKGEHQQILVGTGETADDNGNIVGRTTADKHALATRWNNPNTASSAVPCEGILRHLSLCPPYNQSSPISLSSAATLREVHTPAENVDTPVTDVCDPVASVGQSSETTDYSTWKGKSGDDRVALSMHLRDRLRSLVASAPKSSEKKFRKSVADGSGSNDGFWEKYLTESPSSTDTEPDSENDTIENDASPRERQFL